MEVLNQQLQKHQDYFLKNGDIPLNQRILALKKLKRSIKTYEKELEAALKIDLGKPAFEAFTTEIGFLYMSIDHTLKHLKKWARVRHVKSELAQMIGTSHVYPSPYGVVLIIGPFNYPVQLLLEPLIGALAGGNVAMLKPSELTPNVEAIMTKLIAETFHESYVSVATGGIDVSTVLLSLPFDYVFFTGSVRVGKVVMEKASHHLTPITLELGGKSPAIVDQSANLALAAERLAWGKFVNAGQTCVAPDYVLIHETVYEEFLIHLQKALLKFYGKDPVKSPDYGRIVSERHVHRLANLIDENRQNIVTGGEVHLALRYVAPTIFKNVTSSDTLMEEELFGPLLPTIPYKDEKEIVEYLKKHPKPLAFYVFSENKIWSEHLLRRFQFGGGCINDTITHVASFGLPFGGVGPSGMGRYRGEASFKAFTYEKAIVKRSTRVNINLLYPPYKDKLKLIKKVIR